MLRLTTIALFFVLAISGGLHLIAQDQTVGCPGVNVFGEGDDSSQQSSWEDGVINLPGSGSPVISGYQDVLELGTDDFSLTVRFRADSENTGTHVIFDMRYEQETVQGISLFTYGGRLGFQMADGLSSTDDSNDWTNFVSDEEVVDEQWHVVTITVDRDDTDGGRFYLDGEHVYTFNPTGHQASLTISEPVVHLGSRSDAGSGHFYGQMSAPIFFPCALPPAIASTQTGDAESDFDQPVLQVTEAPLSSGTFVLPPAFPDQPFIFTHETEAFGIGELYFVSGHGAEPIPMTPGLEIERWYDLSPDGRYLSFQVIDLVMNNEFSGTHHMQGNYIYDFLTGELITIEVAFPDIPALRNDNLYSISTLNWLAPDMLAVSIFQGTSLDGYHILNLTDRTHSTLPLPGDIDLDVYQASMPQFHRLSDDSWMASIYYWIDDDDRDINMAFYTWDANNLQYDPALDIGEVYIGLHSGRPVLSNGGEYYAAVTVTDETPEIIVGHIDGSPPETVFSLTQAQVDELLQTGGSTVAEHLIRQPEWSPDDSQLAFVLDRKVYVMNADGTDGRLLDVFPEIINDVSWVTNDLLRVGMNASTPGYQLLGTDGKLQGQLVYEDQPVERVLLFPSGADESVLQVIRSLTTDIEASLGVSVVTSAPIPTIAPTPTPVSCAGAPPSRVYVGRQAFVTISEEGETREDLRVRAEPGGERVSSMAEGTIFDVIGGPVCQDGFTWWQIRTLDGSLTGWSAEGSSEDDYFMAPQ